MHEAEAESAPEGGVEQDFLLHGSPAQARLEDQIAWYDAKSRHNQRWFKLLKVWQIVVAAAIPVAAAAEAPVWLMGGGGALIVVLEGFQQLQQYQQNWTTYRSTCERLKHEKYLFAARGTLRRRGSPGCAGGRARGGSRVAGTRRVGLASQRRGAADERYAMSASALRRSGS